MAKKAKNKQKKSNKGTRDNGKKETPRGSRKRGRHHSVNWKAGNDDPVRRAVEADGLRTIVDMAADGNCLFRALSDQLYADYGNKCDEVRSEVCDFLEEHEDDFSFFLILDEEEEDEDAADYETYVQNMREDGEWGGNVELVAAARFYRRNITVFTADLSAFTIPHGDSKVSGPDLYVSYHDNDHYNSVRNTKGKTPSKHESEDDDSDYEDMGNRKAPSKTRESAKSNGRSKQPPAQKKNDPCSCGSGVRYKKCCLKREKHATRLEKMQANNCQSDEEEEKKTEKVEGGFRIMKI